jgi:hypothetical protein
VYGWRVFQSGYRQRGRSHLKCVMRQPTATTLPKAKKRLSEGTSIPTSAHTMRHDPILQELWAIKAEINKEAHYDVATLLRNAQSVVKGMRSA